MDRRPTELHSLNALRAFEAAGRRLSFRAAADDLGVTQGAVAQHVRGLEARLGLKLFDRLPGILALTDVGRRYHRSIMEAFRTISDATADLGPDASRVTVSATSTFASKWLIPNLGSFAEANPTIELAVVASDKVASFHSDGIDMAVRQARPPFGASLDAELLFRQDLVAVCNPRLLAPLGSSLSSDELVGLGLLHDTHDLWPAFFAAAFGTVPDGMAKGTRLSQTSLALDAAVAGQGVALASRFLVQQDIARGLLVEASPFRLRGPQDFYVLSPRAHRSPGSIERVRSWFLTYRDRQTDRA